ncbi:MAG: DUF5058 family protein [Sedimentibacter sp.]|uniref:DUF5058 family protein n=1 Tax=Sedimentibacter sp. TaxID=1960295 RepID=UPI0031591347
MNYINTANSTALWLSCIPVVVIVAFQAIIFSKKAMNSADLVDLNKQDAKKAFTVGALSAIGPALGVFVVMLGLMSVIGAPLSWMRLAIIGAAPTELAAANMSAKAMNIELTSPEFGLIHFANAAWVMALNGSAWLFTTGLFSHKLDGVTDKISGGDPKKLGILMVSAMCGAFSYLFGKELIKGLDPKTRPFMVSGIAAAVAMIILDKVAKKYPKLTEYNLGIAMVVGMAAGVIFKRL